METYVINLLRSRNRRAYMEKVLQPYGEFLKVHFVEAVDGQQFSADEIAEKWNFKEAYKNYGRRMSAGEAACALSHRKCCNEMLKHGDEVALILEDDVTFREDNLKALINAIESEVKNAKAPYIILLSGDYWWIRKRQRGAELCLAKVYEAMGALSYVVNRKAAELIAAAPKEYLADDWYRWRRRGIRLYAVYPHVVDVSEIASEIEGGRYQCVDFRRNLSLPRRLQSYYQACVRQTYGRILRQFETRRK